MSNPKVITDTIMIQASPARVWEALTMSEYTRQYMFGCNVVTDWKVGGICNWQGAADGKIYVTGKVLAVIPQRTLSYSVFDPTAKYPNTPENHLTVTYELEPDKDNNTKLTVTQGDYNTVADGEKRYKETVGGWSRVLNAMKNILEQQPAA